MDIRFAVGDSPLGKLLVAAGPRGICAILMGDDPRELPHDLQERFPHAHLHAGDEACARHVRHVARFIADPAMGLDLVLDIHGTPFQRRVWEILRAIPMGDTASYTEVAQRMGQPTAVRAVARACAANPLAVAIPCHRVLRADGGLSGYRWGLARKQELLAREAASR